MGVTPGPPYCSVARHGVGQSAVFGVYAHTFSHVVSPSGDSVGGAKHTCSAQFGQFAEAATGQCHE